MWSELEPVITQMISGGQTGADRVAFDFAPEFDIPHGGWIPKGRRAEDGVLFYETSQENYLN